ncbi:MAG: 2'-5' RNA ligase family protein [Anaeroplasmataceae bacterium]|nr:2'-5' RNA ligase family protein [Anaeroplasmataceae bacterium]
MKQKKFLTLYAVLDEATQEKLTQLQNEIIKHYPKGTQTMGIPFHISLGSFPVDKKEELLKRLSSYSANSFSLQLTKLNHFDKHVLFAEPTMPASLVRLHHDFEGNYSDGFDWCPHVTLYCGTEEEVEALLHQLKFQPMKTSVVGLELGEFFPPLILWNTTF